MKSTGAKEHRGCILLKPEENEEIFRLIGNRCQCLAAGVIQLYLTDAPTHREWLKKNTGVITLIRDNPKRSYFLRLYCLQKKAMLWEQELYNSMDYNAPMTYFHTFEGEDCMAAFNFANDTEAMIMRNVIMERLNSNKQRRQERKAKIDVETQPNTVTLRKKSPNSGPNFFSPNSSSTNITNGSPSAVGNGGVSGSAMYKRKVKREKEPKRKLTVADIGRPSDFRHVAHLGWNASKGLEIDAEDPSIMQFLNVAGVTPQQMTNRNTRAFIYDFIGTHGGITAVQNELGQLKNSEYSPKPPSQAVPSSPLPPPPIPARTVPGTTSPGVNNNQVRTAKPLPPVRANVPPPPPSAPPVHRTLPSRPPPPTGSPAAPASLAVPPPPPRSNSNISNASNASNSSGAPAPPPPPPPPPPLDFNITENVIVNSPSNNGDNNNEVTDSRPKLMDEIRSGKTLKKVDPLEKASVPQAGDSRTDLLSEIRKGVPLKPVATPDPKSDASVLQGGLAGALAQALAERSRLLGNTDDSQESSSDSDNNDEWDD